MFHVLRLRLFALLFLLPLTTTAQRYAVGDRVDDFTLTDRATGQPVKLSDFAGKIVFLEWFAWWCPFCQASAAQLEPGVVRYFSERGGNTQGIEVVHLAVNLQSGQEAQTQQFLDAYGFKRVLNDFNRALANRFQPDGQPIFAIINGVAGSPSHRQWELVYSQLGYGQVQFPVETFRSTINAIRAAAPVAPPALPPSILAQPASATAAPGTTVALTVTATGSAPLTYQWLKDGVALPGATEATLRLANLVTASAGDYTVALSGPGGTTTSRPATVQVAAPEVGRLINLAVRSRAGSGDKTLIAGFATTGGGGPGALRLRALGPVLSTFGVPGVLADPRLDVFEGPALLAGNDNVAATDAASFGLTAGALDAALVLSLPAGAYTAQVTGRAGGEGVALIEVNDALSGANDSRFPRLVNVAARTEAGTGADILIAGFTISGNVPKRLLIRALGPRLGDFGVGGFLADPQLQIYRGSTLVAENNDVANADATAAGLAAGSRDAALLLVLPAGVYTAQVSGVGDTSGIALIEVNDLD